MRFSNDVSPHWGKLYRLSFWRWGVTLDWGQRRIILTVRLRRNAGGAE